MGKGSWTFDGTTYQFDFFVTALVTTDEAAWKNAFSHASEILFSATFGQMRINKIHFLSSGPLSDDDIFLYGTELIRSSTSDYCKACESPAMSGNINLDPRARERPNTIVHELGHYLCCLRDEYYEYRSGGSTTNFRLCTNDVTQNACFMEFGPDKGLQLDDAGNVSSTQPPHVVDQFCFGDYRDGTGNHLHALTSFPSVALNDQEQDYRKSCWETMKDVFDQLNFPNEQTSDMSEFQDPEWIERTPTNKYALVILGATESANLNFESAIRNSINAWASFAASGNHQLALLTDSALDQPVRPMKAIRPNELAEFSKLIGQLDFMKKPEADQSVAELFSDAEMIPGLSFFLGPMAAFQYLVLLAPGDYDSDQEIDLAAVVSLFEQLKVQLVVTTYGSGTFSDRWEALNRTRKSVYHQNIPSDNPELDSAFELQNDWTGQFFETTPGWDEVAIFRGTLPAPPDIAQFAGEVIKTERDVQHPLEDLDLDIRSGGVDFPVMIEQTAQAAMFVLSKPVGEDMRFSLISPDGREFDETSAKIEKSEQSNAITWFEIPAIMGISGRWILRLERTAGIHPLPFYLFATSYNDLLDINVKIEVAEGRVNFECRTRYRFALDFVDVHVEVYRADAKSFSPDEMETGLVLRRQHARHPQSEKTVELSTGTFTGSAKLNPGSYIAIFTARNAGQAAYATNPSGSFNSAIVETDDVLIPAFSRASKRRFIVRVKE